MKYCCGLEIRSMWEWTQRGSPKGQRTDDGPLSLLVMPAYLETVQAFPLLSAAI